MLAVVVMVDVGVLLPQPQTASSRAIANRITSFFMNLPDLGITMRIERCGRMRQWM